MRAQSDAVMIGIGTLLADDPLLTCRLPGMAASSPVRVVLDSALRLPLASRLVRGARETPVWVVAAAAASRPAAAALQAQGVEILRAAQRDGGLDLAEVLKSLAARGITRLMVEGGPILAAAFVAADLVDEANLFQSSTPIGAAGIDALEGLPLTALTQSPRLDCIAREPVGVDTLAVYERE
jgi:diaminohydroxyphosphoribosylaminopyrimidine deaminase/5-amino-6-(5-phosphoribosylamino)uracil reductase